MSFLGSFLFSQLMQPWVLVLWIVPALLFVLESLAKAPGVLAISTGETLAGIRGHEHAVLRRVPPILRALGLALFVVALARPVTGVTVRPSRTEVVDIMLCIDVSSSMMAVDFRSGGRDRDRLFVTKETVHRFINDRKMEQEDRYGLDRMGMILYAEFAWTAAPLTLDYDVLEHELREASINPNDRRYQRTAIGSALGLAVSKLSKSEAKSKVIVLLSDGRNNSGEIDPITAAQFAKEFDIRVYTIAAGSGRKAYVPGVDLFGRVTHTPVDLPVDEETLQRIAEITDGRYFRATDTESLQKAYDEINQLETTGIEVTDFYDYEEGFVPWVMFGTTLLLASVFIRRFWFDPLP